MAWVQIATESCVMSSLLASWCMNLYNDVSRLLLRYLLMCDFFVEKVSWFLMSRLLMSSHLKKKMRWLLIRCLLTTTWTGLLPSIFIAENNRMKSVDLSVMLTCLQSFSFWCPFAGIARSFKHPGQLHLSEVATMKSAAFVTAF